MKDLPITMMPDGWMEKTGGYAKDMTLRDYFAAKAMEGFAANLGPRVTFESRAKIAYQWADAMLEAGNAA